MRDTLRTNIYASFCPVAEVARETKERRKEMKLTFKGTIAHIGDIETFASGFCKRTVVVDDGRDRPNPIPFQARKDDCVLVGQYSVGQRVEVDYYLNGRQWDGPNGTKWFVDLSLADIRPADGAAAQPAGAQVQASAKPSCHEWKEKAIAKDVFAAYEARNHLDANGMVAQLNDRNSPFSQLRLRVVPNVKWKDYTPENFATLLNAITGAQKPASAYEDPVAMDLEFNLPF